MTRRRALSGRLAPALLAGAVALGLAPASGQEPHGNRVVVCEGGSGGRCVEVDPALLPEPHGAPMSTQQAPARTTLPWRYGQPADNPRPDPSAQVPYWQSSPSDPAPPAGSYFPAAPAQPSQAWLEWVPEDDPSDPGLMVPGRCAWTAENARGRWLTAARMGDVNALSAAYQWRGKTHDGATPILDRLASVPVAGHWEQAVVGALDVRAAVPRHWRWTDGVSSVHLGMREVDGCWFVEFTDNPGDVVEVSVPTQAQASELSPSGQAIDPNRAYVPASVPGQGWIESPTPNPAPPRREPTRVDPDNPDVLVF